MFTYLPINFNSSSCFNQDSDEGMVDSDCESELNLAKLRRDWFYQGNK